MGVDSTGSTMRAPLRSLAAATLLGLAASALGGCSSPGPVDTSGVRTMDTQRNWEFLAIGPSDVVRVTVVGHADWSTSPEGQRVDPQGNLHLAVIGKVNVQGKHIEQINEELHEAYGRILHAPQVTAEVVQFQSRGFYAFGQFADPGFKVMDRPLSALEAFARSGALLRGADRENVFVMRPHADRVEVHTFNMKSPGVDAMVAIRPGDLIYVRQTGYEDFQEDLLPILAGLGFPAWQVSVAAFGD